ncbi:putative MFS transporter, AGZA family, xanthine/uracil permease [Seinonella peptonophila]|uniref:Putative MFS transporter, AGZA family, xanthine/uracil permease n=1 Tax=Seinonella peptonophila TaxID=112248 RepID=A0A1M4TJ09_9BACL|nr:NCS2 family permease [Seinonella peptonophila]SHE44395.1 putative MFS transporter, AGZA family, xanthine/uracil permease [Seinonella peptonophila]
MAQFLERIFKLQHYKTTIRTELLAGFTTFVTMAYIIIIQPSLMKAAGMPTGAVTVSTIIVSGIFSIIMGIYANRPFAVAPGMGGNAFMAYSIVASGLATWQTGLGMVFISGVVFLILTFLGIREMITKVIPVNLKYSIGAAVGIFIASLGFSNAGIVVPNKTSGLLQLGSLHDPKVLLALIGLAIILGLMARNVNGAVLYGILVITLISIPFGFSKLPTHILSLPPNPGPIIFQVDWVNALKLAYIPLMFTFFTGEFFSTMGTVLGVSEKAGLLDQHGNLPGIKKPFIVDGLATVGGSVMGLTPVTTYVESASGVAAGGRTGLTAIFTGIIFFITLFLTPILTMIPTAATAPALVAIGLSMLTALKNLDFTSFEDAIPALLMVIITAFTANLANGIVFGILAYVVIHVLMGKMKQVPLGLYILCIPLVYFLWLK